MPDPRSFGPGFVPDLAKQTDDSAGDPGGQVTIFEAQSLTVDTSGITTATDSVVTFTVTDGVLTTIADT